MCRRLNKSIRINASNPLPPAPQTWRTTSRAAVSCLSRYISVEDSWLDLSCYKASDTRRHLGSRYIVPYSSIQHDIVKNDGPVCMSSTLGMVCNHICKLSPPPDTRNMAVFYRRGCSLRKSDAGEYGIGGKWNMYTVVDDDRSHRTQVV